MSLAAALAGYLRDVPLRLGPRAWLRDTGYHLRSRGTLAHLRELLPVLEGAGARATFFVVASVARAHPEIPSLVADAGHELGCHGLVHRDYSPSTPEELAAEAGEARDVLSSHGRVEGFRAPYLALRPDQLGALREAGYAYDSSLRRPPPGLALPEVPPLASDWDVFVGRVAGREALDPLKAPDGSALLLHPHVVSRHLDALREALRAPLRPCREVAREGGVGLSFDVGKAGRFL